MKLKNKIAVVTGASKGIGRAIALAIAQNGGQLALIARTESDLLETQKQINDIRGKAEIFPADLGNREAVQNLAENILKTYGHALIKRTRISWSITRASGTAGMRYGSDRTCKTRRLIRFKPSLMWISSPPYC